MKKNLLISFMITLLFTSCQPSKLTNKQENLKPSMEATMTFPMEVTNNEQAINGGTLIYGLALSSGFSGLFDSCFSSISADMTISAILQPSLLLSNKMFINENSGPIHFSYDREEKTVTFQLMQDVLWHDLTPVTLDDMLFAYEVIGHKDYQGVRYDQDFINIVGMEEYHSGKTPTISGMKLSEDKKTLTIKLKEIFPSVLYAGSMSSTLLPRHYWEGIEVKDMESHEKARSKTLGWGPFKINQVVPGESVELVAFDDYYLGKPKLEKIIVKVFHPDLVPMALKDGSIDIISISPIQYLDHLQPTNYQYLGKWYRGYNYIAFKLGTWDNEKGEVLVNPDAKTADEKLRHAVGYAINEEEICEQIYGGLRKRATTIIDPRHEYFQDKAVEKFYYDPQKAQQILDEAGYLDIDGDGFREDKQGNSLELSLAAMQGGANNVSETITNTYIQNLGDVGLNVKLFEGRLHEANVFYKYLENDQEGIDLYVGGWTTGANPNPASLYGKTAKFNFPRYTSARFEEILTKIDSVESFDEKYMLEQYKEWQKVFFEESPTIPTEFIIEIVAVNNRVKNYHLVEEFISPKFHLIELTNEEAYRAN